MSNSRRGRGFWIKTWWPVALMVASDEFHQSFLRSGTGSQWNVSLDFREAECMCLVADGIARLSRPKWLQRTV